MFEVRNIGMSRLKKEERHDEIYEDVISEDVSGRQFYHLILKNRNTAKAFKKDEEFTPYYERLKR